MFHVKHLFGFQGVEGVQQIIEIVGAVVLQLDAALLAACYDLHAAAERLGQLLLSDVGVQLVCDLLDGRLALLLFRRQALDERLGLAYAQPLRRNGLRGLTLPGGREGACFYRNKNPVI